MAQILCVDFDGVIHSYTSRWIDAATIPDPPVPGAMAFLKEALDNFEVHIFSSRSNQPGGIEAMETYIAHWWKKEFPSSFNWMALKYPTEKPPALVTLDDRALTFMGTWPAMTELRCFKPWNRGGRQPEKELLEKIWAWLCKQRPVAVEELLQEYPELKYLDKE